MNKGTDELDRLENVSEVFAPEHGVENAATEMVPGPFYAAAEEVLTGIDNDLTPGDKENPAGKAFPVGRRDFMKLFSMGAAAGATACVRRPVESAIPYVNQPVDHVPGVATHYATTCGSCSSGCGVVVKTREGRPVKLEGNEEHALSQGALCSLGQADLQGLYHPERQKSPRARYGKRYDDVSWEKAYKAIAEAASATQNIAILTGGSTGHRQEFFRDVLIKLGAPAENVFAWESNTLFSSIATAHKIAFGKESLPRCDLEEANLIVGLGSDFLDVGTAVVYHTKGFTRSHSFDGEKMGRLVQFESHHSLTGGRADTRYPILPGSELHIGLMLVKALLEQPQAKGGAKAQRLIGKIIKKHASELSRTPDLGVSQKEINELAKDMMRSKSVVLAGGSASFHQHSTQLQLVAVAANILVGAYDDILHLDKGWINPPAKAGELERFLAAAKDIDVCFVIDVDPIFTSPASWGVKEALTQIGDVISIQPFPNEVDQIASYSLPGNHYLESWGDEQPAAGFWSARQPTVRAFSGSRQAEDSLLWILAHAEKPLGFKDYQAYLKKKWRSVYRMIGASISFEQFFEAILRKGFVGQLRSRSNSQFRDVSSSFQKLPQLSDGMVLVAPLDHRLLDGRGAHLPVLQEIGDGMTTITWDSWVALNPHTVQKLGLKRNQVVKVSGDGGSYEAAVYPLPGLHPNAVVTPRGNGHQGEYSTISHNVGVDPLVAMSKRSDSLSQDPATSLVPVSLEPQGRSYRLASMQKHNDIANRKDIVKQVSLKYALEHTTPADVDTVPDLFPKLEEAEHKWGMSIDLSKCTGCGACMAACSIENNVPQVGREQILLGREMHWIRLDRYFYGDLDKPTVTFQPVMCQHCNHAPCEAVCPVFATTHDAEGMNAMTYNRCVGTRYCANACPYKVRRFNWWTHKWGEMGERPLDRNPRALNPDVTVRTRGVMEKCSFCVGRLRDAKHAAAAQDRPLRDGEAMTACQQTCPADAITFGNLKDPSSEIAAARKDPRAYLMLGGDPAHGHYGIKTLPSVNYLAQVMHEVPAADDHH